MITVRSDTRDLEELIKGLESMPGAVETVTMRAINKTVVSARAEAVRLIRKDYNVKARDIRKVMKITRATKSHLQASIRGWGSPGIPLYVFSPTPKRVPSTKRLKSGGYAPKGGIKVLVRRDRGRKQVAGAFIARMRSGHVGVFRRTGLDNRSLSKFSALAESGRHIRELYGPSPVSILAGDRYDKPLDEFISATMEKHIDHETDFFMRKMGLR